MKKISIILFIIAGVILCGLLLKWEFNIWKFIDYAIIIINIILGVIIWNKNKIDKNYMKKILKSKIFWGIIFLIVVGGIGFLAVSYKVKQKKIEDAKCKFVFSEIIENRYQEDKESFTSSGEFLGRVYSHRVPASHKTYWEIDSVLKNNSANRQYLKSIIVKIYTNDQQNILLTEFYKDVKKWLEPNQSYPFQIRANLDRTDPVLNKYFEKDDEVRIDLYPYFMSCEY